MIAVPQDATRMVISHGVYVSKSPSIDKDGMERLLRIALHDNNIQYTDILCVYGTAEEVRQMAVDFVRDSETLSDEILWTMIQRLVNPS